MPEGEEMTQRIDYQPGYAIQSSVASSPLTKREWEVLWMISKGHDNKGIAELLGIRTQTVKNHTSNVLSKMQARNRTHAAMMAIRKGWLDFPIDGVQPTTPGTGAESGQDDERLVPGPGRDAMNESESRFRITG